MAARVVERQSFEHVCRSRASTGDPLSFQRRGVERDVSRPCNQSHISLGVTCPGHTYGGCGSQSPNLTRPTSKPSCAWPLTSPSAHRAAVPSYSSPRFVAPRVHDASSAPTRASAAGAAGWATSARLWRARPPRACRGAAWSAEPRLVHRGRAPLRATPASNAGAGCAHPRLSAPAKSGSRADELHTGW
jgi:hypothetical protein